MRSVALLVMLAAPLSAHADMLAWVETKVAKRYAVRQLPVAEARAALHAQPENWLVLDVREAEEFSVSHLPGAVHVAPDTTAEEFADQFSDDMTGRRVLLYCSVGQRSSKLADRIAATVEAAGGQGVANLRGGIFRWHGEHGPLVNADGPTDEVHPYNWFWGWLRPQKPQQP